MKAFNGPIYFLFCLGLCLLFGTSCGPSEVTVKEASEKIIAVGGVERINKEASLIFARLGTNAPSYLNADALGEFPSMKGLGSSLAVDTARQGLPPRILVKYGSHRRTKFIMIYHADYLATVTDHVTNHFPAIQIASNIYFLK